MKWLFLVNAVDELAPEQTTTLMARGAALRGHKVCLVGVADLALGADGDVRARGRAVSRLGEVAPEEQTLDVEAGDLVVIRTNPARDLRGWAHETALQLMAVAAERGTVVVNDPRGLLRATSKLYLAKFPPEVRPETLISRDPVELEAFVRMAGRSCVLKPLRGTRGRDVFRLDPDATGNLRQIIDVLVRDGHAVAQHFVPEAVDGDTRVVLVEGELLEVGGCAAVVRRIPGAADFRSNVAVGGSAAPGEVNDVVQRVVQAVGPVLRRDGMMVAGLDLIGDRVVEVNVFSTGGLYDASRFTGVDLVAPVLDAYEARANQRRSSPASSTRR